MDISQIPLFAMLRGRLGYLSQRQQVIAENVANSDTAGFLPKDLKPFSFHVADKAKRAGTPAQTHAAHLPLHSQAGGTSGFTTVKAPDSETRLDGNAVVLEEEMMKLTDSRMNYEAAIGFYQKSLGLLRLAARAPGR